MLGLGSSLLQGGALRSIVRSGLQLFYKADRTQAPLGEEQVRNNSFDEITGNLVSNPTFNLGSEEVVNGDFAADSDWTKRNGSTINNVANVIAGGSIGSAPSNWSLESLANVFENSKTYRIKFRAKQVSLAGSNAGAFQVGNSYGVLFDEVITSEFVDYTFTAQTSSNYWPKLTIGGQVAGDVFQIDDISVKEVPNWELQSNWSVSENQVVSNGSDGWIKQKNVVTNDESYQVVFSAEVSSGRFRAVTTSDASTYTPYITESGTYTFYMSPTSSLAGGFEFVSDEFNGSISNVSVKQLDPNNRWTISNDTPSEQTVQIREGSFFIEYDSTATKGAANINVPSAGVANQEYEIKVVVDSINNDEKLKVQLGNSAHNLSVGVNIFKATSTSTGTLTLGRTHVDDSVTATVSSVSLRKITNSIKDHSKNSNDGILYSGKALALDPGTNAIDYVSLRPSNEMGISSAGYTFAIWFNADTTQSNGSDKRIFTSRRAATGSYFAVLLTNNGHLKVYFRESGALPSTTVSTNYRDDNWHRLVISASTNAQYIYVDNELVGTSTHTLGDVPSSDLAYLGAGVTPDDATMLKCKLADFQIYDKAWNATDVKYDWESPDKDVFDRVGEAQILGHERIPYPNLNETGLTGWNTSNTSSPDYTITATEQGVRYVNNGASSSPAHTFSINLGNNSIVSGKTYSLEVVISEFRGTGGIKFASTSVLNSYPLSSPGTINFNSDGTHTHVFTAGDNLANFSVYRNSSNVDLTIKSISIKEVTTHASHILPTDCKSLLRLNEGAGDRVYDAAPVLGEDQMESRNGSFELGAEEVVDGNFPIGTSAWELINGATISGNKANIIGDGSTFTSIKQTGVFENGKVYQVVVDVTINSGLGLKFQDGATNENIGFATTTGVYTFNFTGTSNADLVVGRRTAGTAFNSSVNSISVKEMTTWSYVDSIELNDSGVFFNNSNDNIFQNFDYIDGATYAIGFEGTSDTGLIRYRTGFAAPAIEKLEVPIPGTITFTPDSTSQRIQIFGPSSGTATVSKVTIKQIKPAESFFITGDKNFIHQQPYIPQYAMSSFSKKAFFDGVNDYVGGSFNGNIGPAEDITFSCWFSYEDNVVSSSDRQTLFGLLFAPTDEFPYRKFEVGIYETNRIVVYTGDGTTATPSSTLSDISSPLSNNKLNHVAVSLSSNGLVKIYVNGVENTTATHTNFGASSINNYRIGSRRTSGTSSLFNKGIIDEVSLFKSELTQAEVLELYNSGSSFDSTGHSKYNLGEEVSNGTFELGSEEVVNGDFATKSDWVEGLGFDISGGVMNYDGSAIAYRRANQVLNTEIGALYKLQFTLNDLSTSGVNFGLGNSDGSFSGIAQQTYSSDGTYTRYMVATIEDHSIVIQNNSATQTFNVDNISVKKIPNWSFGDGWSYVDGKASLVQVSSSEYLSQELTGLVNGRTYVISFDLDISSSASSIGVSSTGAFGDASSSDRFHSTNGRKTFTAVYDSSHQSGIKELRFVGTSGAAFTIDNVSVQEYGVSGYWRNNGADQWDDLSINSNHGTVSGSPTEIFLQEVPFFGKDSLGMFMNKPRLGGLNFAKNGWVEVRDNVSLDVASTNAISVCCWYRANSAASYDAAQYLVNSETYSDAGGWTLIAGTTQIVWTAEAGSNASIGYNHNDRLGWQYIVATYDEQNYRLFTFDENGNISVTTPVASTSALVDEYPINIGGFNEGSGSLINGVIDDIKIYNKALTQAEIKKNYNATKGKHKN